MLLYPRVNSEGKLVEESQMVGIREHLAQKHRIIFLTGILGTRCPTCNWGETESHNLLFALDSLSHEPVKMVITSPGGELDSTFLLYDAIQLVKSPIITLGRYCVSAAVLLLAAGKKRYLMPHAKVMLHLPAGQMGGDARDWEIQHREMEKYKARIVDILIECGAKRKRAELLADMDRDFWLEPKEAIEYGLCDEIITPKILQGWLK